MARGAANPILCFTEEAINGFCLLQETKMYVNLRPLLLPTPVGWAAIVYVAAVLCMMRLPLPLATSHE